MPGLVFPAGSTGHLPEVVHGEAEIGQDVFHGNAAPRFERGDSRVNGGNVFRRDRLIVEGRQRQFPVERREHGLKQAIDGRELIAGQAVDIGVDVLTLFGNVLSMVESHGTYFLSALPGDAAAGDDHLRASCLRIIPSSRLRITCFSSASKRLTASNWRRRSSSGPR